jgi:MFS family permease
VTEGAREQGRDSGGMSARAAAWLAWSLWAVCVVLIALALLLDFVTDEVPFAPEAPEPRLDLVLAVLTAALSLAYPTVGALIASRLPTNLIGWLFCGVGLLYVGQDFTAAYADYALLETFALPWGEYAAWFSSWVGFAAPTLGVILMLVFPDGRLASRRWWIVAWAALLGAALAALAYALKPGPLYLSHEYVNNPFKVVGVIGSGFTTYDLFGASIVLGLTLLATSTVAALLSVFLRMHRTQGDEHQQLKWFLYAAVPLSVCLSLVLLQWTVAYFTTDFLFNTVLVLPGQVFVAIITVAGIALLIVPIVTYIAMLKYRLYDIDVAINRALVYGSLTVLLAAVYFGGVTATQAIFRALTGQEEQPQLAIVVSTLVIAALFNPLRRRIQGFIDRRFYRRKYDAAKTLKAFSTKLHEETDLDALSDDLVGVVRETMQPAHVSL